MSLTERDKASEPVPGYGPLTQSDKNRGWIALEDLMPFCAQIKRQRENDGSRRKK